MIKDRRVRRTGLVALALFVLLPVLAFPELIFAQQTLRRSMICFGNNDQYRNVTVEARLQNILYQKALSLCP